MNNMEDDVKPVKKTARNGKDVCPRDCPGRTKDCHATCKKYKKFRDKKLKEYEERWRESCIGAHISDSINRRIHKTPVILKYKDGGRE